MRASIPRANYFQRSCIALVSCGGLEVGTITAREEEIKEVNSGRAPSQHSDSRGTFLGMGRPTGSKGGLVFMVDDDSGHLRLRVNSPQVISEIIEGELVEVFLYSQS